MAYKSIWQNKSLHCLYYKKMLRLSILDMLCTSIADLGDIKNIYKTTKSIYSFIVKW